jgi:Kef-type K+ transport system membrane component KefB
MATIWQGNGIESMNSGFIFLLQVLTVVVLPLAVLHVSRLKGFVPLVVVQILVGIVLGPSLFGRIAPEYYQLLFNSQALSQLSGIASVAVLFFGLISGLHLDLRAFRGNGRAFTIVAAASVIVPTGLGFLAGLWIAQHRPEVLGERGTAVQFAAAFGICTGVTALPVLGAILHEMDLLGSRIGHLALGIAGFNDVALWILLGFLLTSVAGHGAEGLGAFLPIVVLPIYVALMANLLTPLLRRVMLPRMKNGEIDENGLAVVCAVTIGSALITQSLGLHYILGAFVAGAIMPEETRKAILNKVQVMTLGLLMPFFFLLTGLRTLVELGSAVFLEVVLLATVVASVGKIGGTAMASKMVGESWPHALGLGGLLQTKGLMEVIVLTTLLDAAIISRGVFSALVLMAVVSTALAMPLARMMLALDTRGAWDRDASSTEERA